MRLEGVCNDYVVCMSRVHVHAIIIHVPLAQNFSIRCIEISSQSLTHLNMLNILNLGPVSIHVHKLEIKNTLVIKRLCINLMKAH